MNELELAALGIGIMVGLAALIVYLQRFDKYGHLFPAQKERLQAEKDLGIHLCKWKYSDHSSMHRKCPKCGRKQTLSYASNRYEDE
jgi:hypothetical protein